nr:carboxypeptidase A6 isoform X2 [Ipomoea batatas]
MENVNGRKLVEKGELCERRNGRGVDLNRNWSVDWGKKEKDYDPYEENPGTSPFSEPETQLMRKLSTSFEPHIWVNVHSGMEALFMPYDHKNTTPDGFLSQRMKMMLEKLNHFHLNNRCLVGSGGGSVGSVWFRQMNFFWFNFSSTCKAILERITCLKKILKIIS